MSLGTLLILFFLQKFWMIWDISENNLKNYLLVSHSLPRQESSVSSPHLLLSQCIWSPEETLFLKWREIFIVSIFGKKIADKEVNLFFLQEKTIYLVQPFFFYEEWIWVWRTSRTSYWTILWSMATSNRVQTVFI